MLSMILLKLVYIAFNLWVMSLSDRAAFKPVGSNRWPLLNAQILAGV